MNKLELSLHYNKAIVASDFPGESTAQENISLLHEMFNLGYVPSTDFLELMDNKLLDIKSLYVSLMPVLRNLVGAHVEHTPMYPNFPKQVAEMSDFELYMNAMCHYWTAGTWLPEFEVELRKLDIEPNAKFKEIDIIISQDLWDKIDNLALSPDSLTTFDKDTIRWAIDNNVFTFNEDYLAKITFAETRCIILAEFLKNGDNSSFGQLLNNVTDVLRTATYLSGGDVSLAANTKFKNFKRSERRFLTEILDTFWDAETAVRHKNKWIKLLHSLHVGDYSKSMWRNAQKLRENVHIETFNGDVEARLIARDLDGAIKLLSRRPSEFARRVDHLLRLTDNTPFVIRAFDKVLKDVPTKIVAQLIGHFNNRSTERKSVVLPKGQMAKAVLIDQKGELANTDKTAILRVLYNTLLVRFQDKDPLAGKVWIDPALAQCPVPSGMRSVTAGLVTVPRGTRYEFGDDNTLRFFVHWKGRDIDLSATYHDEDFKTVDHVSYTNLKSTTMEAYHSGDITSAPNGASEFIDININVGLKKARYVAMSVLSYSQEPFNEIEECFVGWMGRSKPESNEIYDPKTVKHCIHLVNPTKYVCPVIFDLKERKAIFVDMTKNIETHCWGNNVESNRAGIEDILYAAVNPKKMSLYDLFESHTLARATGMVDKKEDADITFGITDCDVTPADWADIQTDWMG